MSVGEILENEQEVVEELSVRLDEVFPIINGTRNANILRHGHHYAMYGVPKDVAIQEAKRHAQAGFGEKEITRTIDKAYAYIIRKSLVGTKQVVKKDNHYDVAFPIEVFPELISTYIDESSLALGHSKQIMACAYLAMLAGINGNSHMSSPINGWVSVTSLWIAVVQDSGKGKSPAFKNMMRPLSKINAELLSEYAEQKKEYVKHVEKCKREKVDVTMEEPRKEAFITNSATIEGLMKDISKNKIGVIMDRDELLGWFKDLEKYSSNGDLEAYLSLFDGKSYAESRKVAEELVVINPAMTLFGGVQEGLFDVINSEQNRINGFMYRWLFSFTPNQSVPLMSDRELDMELIRDYDTYVTNLYGWVKNQRNADSRPKVIRFSEDAKALFRKYSNILIGRQNSDEELESMKTFYPKYRDLMQRLSLLMQISDSFEDGEEQLVMVEEMAVEKAWKIIRYFINSVKRVMSNSKESVIAADVQKKHGNDLESALRELIISGAKINKTDLAKKYDVDRKTIARKIDKIKNGNQ